MLFEELSKKDQFKNMTTDDLLELYIIAESEIRYQNIKTSSYVHVMMAIQYIYSKMNIPSNLCGRVSKDTFENALTVNQNNKGDEILVYMYPNGDYYAYNLTNNHPEDGEQFETEMGWI